MLRCLFTSHFIRVIFMLYCILDTYHFSIICHFRIDLLTLQILFCMKKLLLSALTSIFCLSILPFSYGFANAESLTVDAKSSYLMDAQSHTCMMENDAFRHVPIASVCKVMTLSLVFDAIKEGKLTYDTQVTVSDHAASMGGSQVYLQSGLCYPVEQLIKSIVVSSANDSCVALSEQICGDEQLFVEQMNRKAKSLGCEDTVFANCTGLPKLTQYSCAHDVALMFANLIEDEEYFSFSRVWLEDFIHPDNRITSMTNTNKLIRNYRYCDGGKTGFTNEAGFCLASTAQKNGLRLISVVLGAPSSNARFEDAVKLFDYGFNNYESQVVLDDTLTLNDDFICENGKQKYYAVMPERSCKILVKKKENANVEFEVSADNVRAPIAVDQRVGTVRVYRDGVLYDEVPVVSACEVKKQNYFDAVKDVANEWAF